MKPNNQILFIKKLLKKAILTEGYNNDIDTSIFNTPEFKNWFRNSEMVKSDGTPMIFYHGSNSDFNEFDKNKIGSATDAGWLGWGFYFYTDFHEASQYGKVKVFALNITNPYFATDDDNRRLSDLDNHEASKKFTQRLIDDDYDGVYYNGNLRGETVVFEPNQIYKLN